MVYSVLHHLDARVASFVPAGLVPGTDAHRRARLVVFFAALCCFGEVPYGIAFAAMGIPLLSALSFAAVAVFFFTMAILHAGRPRAAIGFVSVMIVGELAIKAVYGGGLHCPAPWALVIVPPMVQLVAGGRAGLWAAFGVGAIGLGFGIATQIGGPMEAILPPAPIFDSSVIGIISLILAGYMGIYERIEQRMRAAVEAQKASAEAAHAHVRLVLDSVDQGFLLLDAQGRVLPGVSAAVGRWFGAVRPGEPFADGLGAVDPQLGAAFALGWAAVVEGWLPVELALSQLPQTASVNGRVLSLSYRESEGRYVVKISDVTAEVERARAEAMEREQLALFRHLMHDRAGFVRFVGETSRLVDAVEKGEDGLSLARELHTIKGNVGFFGLDTLAALCHDIEQAAAGRGGMPTASERAALREAWAGILDRVSGLVDRRGRPPIELEADEYTTFLAALGHGADHAQLSLMARSWTFERVRRPLRILADQARGLAQRLEHGEIDVDVDDGEIRLDPGPWAPFWSSLVHVVRNAVDHGLEQPDERRLAGKAESGRIGLRASFEGTKLMIDVSDDGRGVDWERIREVARTRGMPSDAQDDLVRALFTDGISTRTTVSEVSGRGVGMAAVAQATDALGGSIEVRSVPGGGTTMRFGFERAAGMAGG